jgi:hypothetical protein
VKGHGIRKSIEAVVTVTTTCFWTRNMQPSERTINKQLNNKTIMATNINQIIFTRTQPKKKLEIINSLSEAELMATTEATITKIVKEAGSRLYKSRDKQLRIDYDRRKGNNWNSTVESVELIKGKLYLDFYIQYENTDTNTSEEYDNFFRRGNFRGEIRRLDRYGNGRTYYFCYDETDKARVMRSILLEYVYSKYNDKLKD